MKRLPELPDLPVIFISGYGRDETIARALESGAADYIVKPFSPTELVARVPGGAQEPGPPRTPPGGPDVLGAQRAAGLAAPGGHLDECARAVCRQGPL